MSKNDADFIALLDAPCLFCGYSGSGYWQIKTHFKKCPWRNIASEYERMKRLPRMVNLALVKVFGI